MHLSEFEQRKLDERTGQEMDRRAAGQKRLFARFNEAISLLYVYGLMTDGERNKVRGRFNKQLDAGTLHFLRR